VTAPISGSTCANHPERAAHAVCMACRKTVCQECATEWDGINFCAACLSGRREQSRGRSVPVVWVAWGISVAALTGALCYVTVWAASLFARIF
jgi:hypothetical protein